MAKKPQVSLGMYTGKYVSGSCPMNVLSMAWALKESGMWGGTQWRSSCRVDSNRNYLIADFLEKSTSDFLFIFDEDMMHAPETPIVLAERDLPIVAGLYFHRGEDGEYAPHFYKHEGESPDSRRGHGTDVNHYYRAMNQEVIDAFGEFDELPYTNVPVIIGDGKGKGTDKLLMPIDAAGFGCVMLRRDALEALTPPYLRDEPGLNGDLSFYKKAKAAGVDIWGDASVIATHNSEGHIGLASFYDYVVKAMEEAERKQRPIAPISARMS